MFGGGPARTGIYEGPGPEAPVEAKWRFQTGYGMFSSPAVVGGTVYVGSRDNHVYALE
jgi:outer membrane protein assembly factor BamB